MAIIFCEASPEWSFFMPTIEFYTPRISDKLGMARIVKPKSAKYQHNTAVASLAPWAYPWTGALESRSLIPSSARASTAIFWFDSPHRSISTDIMFPSFDTFHSNINSSPMIECSNRHRGSSKLKEYWSGRWKKKSCPKQGWRLTPRRFRWWLTAQPEIFAYAVTYFINMILSSLHFCWSYLTCGLNYLYAESIREIRYDCFTRSDRRPWLVRLCMFFFPNDCGVGNFCMLTDDRHRSDQSKISSEKMVCQNTEPGLLLVGTDL